MYAMALIIQGKEISIPVLPEKLAVSSPGKNEKVEVLGLGEVLVLRAKGLRSVAWDSFFPAWSAPFVTGPMVTPIEAVRAIQAARDTKKPVSMILTGANLDINTEMGIDDFEYEERYGEVGDLYYSIKLTEWKNYAARKLDLPVKQGEAAIVKEPERAGTPEPPKTYSVVKGDSLWAVSRKCYGTGDKWPKVYDANKPPIGANPNLIYPGQVLKIP